MTGASDKSDRAGGLRPEPVAPSQPSRRSSLARALDRLERFLGSSLLSLVIICVLSRKIFLAAGFGFDEYLLFLIVYINFSTKLEQVHAIAMKARKGTDPQGQDGEAATARAEGIAR